MREEAAAGCAPGTQAEIPLQSVVKTVVKQIVHLQPMEDHDGAGKHALKEAAAYGKDPFQEHVFWQELQPMGHPFWGGP